MAEKYLETLLAQIREKRAREQVRQEVNGHIEDQKEAYLSEGMDEASAEQKAVEDMGDPVETGAALDRIHRPRPAWDMLAMSALLCMIGVLLQYTLIKNASGTAKTDSYYFYSQLFSAATGYLLLCVFYFIDYTRIAHARRPIAALLLLAVLWGICNGANMGSYYISLRFGSKALSVGTILYLSVPVTAATLHANRSLGRKGLYRTLGWMLGTIFLAVLTTGPVLVLNLIIIYAALLSLAALKGWYGMKTRPALATIWGVTAGLPAIWLALIWVGNTGAPYQQARLRGWLHPERFASAEGYVSNVVQQILHRSRLVGSNSTQLLWTSLPEINTNHMLVYIIGYYGILAAAALVLLVLLFAARLLHTSLHQKNQLGMIMGIGCGMVFVLQSAEYILINLGLMPETTTYFPLISYGWNGMIQTCVLLGILLSIYRYQDVAAEPQTEPSYPMSDMRRQA